jgi:hypothetical protein
LTKRIFKDEKLQKQDKLTKVLDEIDRKSGKDTVRLSLAERNSCRQMKQIL